jgi:tetratricopeptide (TPR) repeat protein
MALPAAERALELAARDYDALVAKGRALGQLGEVQPAETTLRVAIGVDPARHEAHRYLAELLSGSGRTTEAVAEFRRAAALAPREPEVLLAAAEALPSAGEAVSLLESALGIRPEYAEALARLGFVLYERGQPARAEQLLRAALGKKPREAGSRALLARLLLVKGDAAGALREARAALGVVKNHALAKLVEADALAARGEIDPAIEAFEVALALAPNDPSPPVHAARACLANSRPTTAQAFALRATQSFPK